jgi:putative endonuclease
MIRTREGHLYTGITTDLARRWQEHSSGKGGARYFRGHVPESICLVETYPDRSTASQREYAIKQLKRRDKDALIVTQASATQAYLTQLQVSAVQTGTRL